MSDTSGNPVTLHRLVGGDQFFIELVDHFYDGIESDDALAHMYPADTTEARRHLAAFLVQYWGGPPAYSDKRGHPRLRMRHMPFRIDEVASAAWLARMRSALDLMEMPPEVESAIWEHFTKSADFLRNAE